MHHFYGRRFTALILGLFLFTLSFGGGCSKGSKKPLPVGNRQKTLVGVSLANGKKEPGKSLRKALEEAAKKEKSLRLVFADAGGDNSKQEEDLQKLTTAGAKGIILQPTPGLSSQAVLNLLARKIKTVVVEKLPQATPVDAYISYDPRRAGELMGQFVLEKIKNQPSPTVLCLQESKGDKESQQTLAAMTSVLQQKPGTHIQVLSPGQGQETSSPQQLTPPPAAIVVLSPALLPKFFEMSGGSAGQQPVAVALGGGKEATAAIQEGTLTAMVDTRPDLMGQMAVKAVQDLLKNQRWDPETHLQSDSADVPARMVPLRLITKENLFLVGAQQGEKKKKNSQEKGSKSSGGGESGNTGGKQKGVGGQQGEKGKGKKTKIKVTTREGKTIEFTVEGEIEKLETSPVGQEGGGQQEGGR